MMDLLSQAGVLFSSAIRIAIPIVYGAMACMICELSGIVNIGVEGMMLAGSFGGVLASYLTGSAWIGLLFAMAFAMVFALLHGILTIRFKTGHIISGLGINLLASGITTLLLVSIWNNRGKSDAVAGLGTVQLTFLKNIPFIGEAFGNLSPLFFLMVLLIIGFWILLYKTVWGLRLRTVGESPKTADSAGINVTKMQYTAVLLCGALAGIGGAYLSIGDIGLFARDMVAGRGYIAMAVNIFGGWNPLGVLCGGMVFGIAQSTQFRLQGDNFPVQIVQMLPYLLTILVLILVKNRARGPSAAGKSFDRAEV